FRCSPHGTRMHLTVEWTGDDVASWPTEFDFLAREPKTRLGRPKVNPKVYTFLLYLAHRERIASALNQERATISNSALDALAFWRDARSHESRYSTLWQQFERNSLLSKMVCKLPGGDYRLVDSITKVLINPENDSPESEADLLTWLYSE